MPEVTLRRSDGATTTIAPQSVETLRGQLQGSLGFPGAPGYEQARAIWNAMIDRRPGMIVHAAGGPDVSRAVAFAREHGLLLAVRAGGHNIAGNAVCDRGLMLDLSAIKSVEVDTKRLTVKVGAGALLGDLDRATQASGHATPLGINSTTGVAGLTLGGGFGWTSRKHGLTIDNLLAADVVTADGKAVRASESQEPDLFWAIRGGGGNFGVVTSFEYRLHPIGPEVLSGLIVHPFSHAREMLDGYRRFAAGAPDELTTWVVLRKAPPLPFLPPEVHGKEVMVLAVCWIGDLEKGRKAIAPLQAMGKPIADVMGPTPFAGWQTAFDPLLTPGARNYWKSHDFKTLGDGLLDILVEYTGRLPSPECEIFVAQLGGAINRVPAGATAYPHRDVEFLVNVHTRWGDPAQDTTCVGWARELFEKMAPHSTGGVYVNFMPEDEAQRVSGGAYALNYERLSRLKAKYDPSNLFRMNQNILPAK